MESTRYVCLILIKPEFCRQIFEKKKRSHIKFHQNTSMVAELFHAGRGTDIKLIIDFRNFANVPNKKCMDNVS
jgi:hypothetical protein